MARGTKGRQPKEPKVVRCYHCDYSTKIKSNLKKHIVNVHVLRRGGPREKCFNCPMCQFTTTRAKMVDHYSYGHNVSISKSCHNFLNLEDFRAWKTKVEKDEASRYVVLKGVSKLKTCHVWYYRCHRDGFFNSKGTGKRNIKVKGTNKINGCCPSEMKVMEDKSTGKVQVHFVKTHFGHSQDLNRLPLLKEDKDRIAEKLALKIPLNKVLDEIQNSKTGDQLERIHLVTRKDVLNIASSYKLKNECVRRSSEGICSEMENWVRHVEQESNVVRFYKAQGETSSEYPELGRMDFVLVVFNDIQAEYLKFHGFGGICIDRTHQRNQHDFELTTLMVTDDLRQGFPCAYLLSNRSDVETISIFVKVITNFLKCPIACDALMSDVGDVYFDAWCRTMPVPSRKFFSMWQVDRSWRRLLSKIKNADKRAYAHKIARSVALERDVRNFELILEPTLKELKSDPDILPFAISFEEEFATTSACWAHCYRVDSRLSCTHLETMHKSVKNAFSQGKRIKRLDTSMSNVMKLVRDTVFDQSIMSFRGALPAGLANIKKRHEFCMNALGTDVVIEKLEAGGWSVECASQIHMVVEYKLVCQCSLRCEDCGICLHSYRCSCYLSTLEWCICQHIHFVASSVNEQVTHVSIEVKHIQEGPEVVPLLQVHHVSQVPQQNHVPHHVIHQAQHQIHHPQRLHHVPEHMQAPQQVLVSQQVQQMQQVIRQPLPVALIQSHSAQGLQTQQAQHAPQHLQSASTQQVQLEPLQVQHTSQQVQHMPQQSQRIVEKLEPSPQQTQPCMQNTLTQVQHIPQQLQNSLPSVQHASQQASHRDQLPSSQQVQHISQPPQHSPQSQPPPHQVQHPPPQVHVVQAQHVSSQTVNGSDDDDDRSMEVLHICETNVACDLEDLIFKQFTKPKTEQDSDLREAKNNALKLVQDIFDAVETRAQLEIFTNAISPVLPTITAMKYSGCSYK